MRKLVYTVRSSLICLALSLTFIIILLSFIIVTNASAKTCEPWMAKVVSLQGNMQVIREGEKEWQPVKTSDTFCAGDIVRVLRLSRADLVLSDDSVLRLDQHTTLTFSKPETENFSLMNLYSGAAYFFSRIRRGLKVVTPFVNAAVEGTEFYVRVESDKTFLSIFEGQVAATNPTGSVILMKGQSAVAEVNKAPLLAIVLRPREAVQWTLYYPPVLYFYPADFEKDPLTSWQKKLRRSMEFYLRGDLQGALASIAEVTEEVGDPRFFTYRSSLLLSVGRVEEAKLDLDKALRLVPGNGQALSLQSIIALTQNEKEQALHLAKEAVEREPRSASARVALSYALQAHFDLKGALASLKDAVRVEPGNALAWARLAEVWLSFGDLKEALEAAKEATKQNPNLARTQTVLGFAHLLQVKIKEAKEAFKKAIELDQADPQPRLGLGLAKIREGELTEGRKEMEIAVSLSPGDALTRSYLGKTYYEEKRDQQASSQLAMAKDLDPSDPTPFFYEAILKQTLNSPVEALQELQKSISLNDNRAIYRSRLLLDADLAARSASLARIYSGLGFSQLALVEGWKSVNIDPANFSAHRLLADSYFSLPRHEIARVSELLQSQLLQPINITPVQPRLAQSDTNILSGAGPSDPSFYEFNPLFNRDKLTLSASGVGGETDTLGNELVHSGLQGRLSYSIGQFHYETDGFRRNNNLRQNIYNLFTQVSLSYRTSIQAEFRSIETENGDLQLRFFPEDFLPNLHEQTRTNAMRLGLHHAFSPRSDLIASVMFQNSASETRDTPFPGLEVEFKIDYNSYNGEVQHLFRSGHMNITSGAGHFHIARKELDTTSIFFPFPMTVTNLNYSDVRHNNLYLYWQINYPKTLTSTLGVSTDIFRGGIVERDQFNPKLGLMWNLLPATTLRGAFFRTFKRTLITDQTLEPTQVAGFNQFFDDVEGTDSWRYGIAVDQKFNSRIYGGAEVSGRKLNVPFEEFPAPPAPPIPQIKKVDWEERLGRAYLYWTPSARWALSAEYQVEKLLRDENFTANTAEHVITHRFPLGINFYHPSGLSAGLKGTYIIQKGEFQPQGSAQGFSLPGEDRFFLVDAVLNYRLPKRYGILTLEGKNLFGTSFNYQDTDPVSPAIQPKRLVVFKFSLSF